MNLLKSLEKSNQKGIKKDAINKYLSLLDPDDLFVKEKFIALLSKEKELPFITLLSFRNQYPSEYYECFELYVQRELRKIK